MNRRRAASSRAVMGSIALTAVVALSLAGCSGDDKPTPSASSRSSSTSSGSATAALKDQSAAVLAFTSPAPVARTEGKLAAQVGAESSPTVPATAEIISVQGSDASTILTWQLSSATGIRVQGLTLTTTAPAARFWPDAVRLIDPVGKKSYAVNTMVADNTEFCVCSLYPLHVGPVPVQMTAEYPPLPATATTISVRIPSFAPVTVPVTR